MLDIYTSISKQHKNLRGALDRALLGSMTSLGYDSDDVYIRSFDGGSYSSCRTVVGSPDILVVYLKEITSYIGKGSLSEIEYARKNSIPVLAAVGYPMGIALVTGVAHTNPNDWSDHATLNLKPVNKEEVAQRLRNFGVHPPVVSIAEPLSDTSEEYLLL